MVNRFGITGHQAAIKGPVIFQGRRPGNLLHRMVVGNGKTIVGNKINQLPLLLGGQGPFLRRVRRLLIFPALPVARLDGSNGGLIFPLICEKLIYFNRLFLTFRRQSRIFAAFYPLLLLVTGLLFQAVRRALPFLLRINGRPNTC